MRNGFTAGAVQQLNSVLGVRAESALKCNSMWPRGGHASKMASHGAGCHGAER
jgi:hypothetical protein